MDQALALAALVDLEGRIVEISHSSIGTDGDLFGLFLWELDFWDPLAATTNLLRDAIAAARSAGSRIDARVVDQAGASRWLEVQIAPIVGVRGDAELIAVSGVDITARKAEADERVAAEQQFRAVFESVDEGFCVCEMIVDSDGLPVDYRFLEVNPLFEVMTGLTAAAGRTALELVPNLEPEWVETYARVAFGGQPLRFQQGSEAMGRWFDVFCVPVAPSGRFALVFKDITDAHLAQEAQLAGAQRDRFRAQLTDQLRTVIDPVAVQSIACSLLLSHLHATRVHYADVALGGDLGVVEVDAVDGVPSVVGEHLLNDYGATLMAEVQSGRTVVVDDVGTDGRLSDDHRDRTATIGVTSYVMVPLLEGDDLAGLFVVHDRAPRIWSPDDLLLIEEVAQRTRAGVLWARAQIELYESEARFRSMADGLPLPVWVHDARGAQEWVNRTYSDSFGISPEQLPSSDWVDLTHPDDVSYVEQFMASIQARAPFHGHVRMQDVDGDWRWLESWAKPRASADGDYFGHIGASADVTKRRAMEDAERVGRLRAELLTDMSAALETAMDPASRITRLLDSVVPRLADYATIEAPSLPAPVLGVRHTDPTKLDVLRQLREHHRIQPDAANSVSQAADGQAQLIGTVTDGVISEYALDAEAAALLAELAPHSHLAVPIDLGNNIKGALMVGVSDPSRPGFSVDDRDFLHALAQRAGVILASTALREVEHEISLRLQQALLPTELAKAPNVSVAARYVASSHVLDVGGDWYDSIELEDGTLLFVVGDVVGHGLDAAAMMGRLRAGLAALARQEVDPGKLLTMLDLYASRPGGADYTTVNCIVLDPTGGQLTYASAGHPPALIIHSDGETRWLQDGRSMPLCTNQPQTRPTASTLLEPGSVVVMYTDGLVERRRESIDLGLDRLRETAIRDRHVPPTQICDNLIEMASQSVTEDDTVVLCFRYDG